MRRNEVLEHFNEVLEQEREAAVQLAHLQLLHQGMPQLAADLVIGYAAEAPQELPMPPFFEIPAFPLEAAILLRLPPAVAFQPPEEEAEAVDDGMPAEEF